MRKRMYNTNGATYSDAEQFYLSGPVKQVMQTAYRAHWNEGKVIQGKLEGDSSASETNYIITFNQKGAKILDQKYGSADSRIDTYNDKGQHITSEWHLRGELYNTITHIFNEQGHLIESIHTDKNGDITSRNVSTFTDTGQQKESISYRGKEGKPQSRTVYEFEDVIREVNGRKYRNVVSSIEYNAEGGIEREFLNKFNEQGKNIESIHRYTDEKRQKGNTHTTQKYNAQGDCIEYNSYNPDGSLKATHTYTHEYDSEGKKIIPPREPFDPYALKPGETEEVENDHHGNWIKKTAYFEKNPTNIFLRQFSYYGEASENEPAFVHPLTLIDPEEVKQVQHTEEIKPEEAKWLAEGTQSGDIFPVHRYYAMKFDEMPSTVSITYAYTEVFALLATLEEKAEAFIIHSNGTIRGGWRERLTRYTLRFAHNPGYLFQVTNINGQDEEEYVVPSYVRKLTDRDDRVFFGQMQLFRPGNSSERRDEWFEETIERYIDDCTLRRRPEKPFINIVETVGNGFAMKEHPVDDNFEIRDLDINYGYGFQQFHSDLMQRFNSSTKGLVLFHGEPGTGKTYYIRHLLRKMVASRKVVIYMPPNMVDHLVEPGFMTFLAAAVRNWSADGNFCVLLIEDAEPLLAKRVEGVRIQGVTNLLNLSDGLLNDMLNLQIICTFNVDLKKLDSALLRPGRLIARKEFKPLGELDANLLAQRLGIKHHFTAPATLGEIYALRKNQNTLVHDVAPERDASTILDDLI